MTRSRKLLLVVAGLVVLVLVVLLLLPFLIDVNVYRGSIEAKAEEILGREVALGEMSLSFVPLGLRVDDIAIGSLPGEGEGDLLTAESLRVGARLGPLLSKRLEITRIVVQEPSMLVVRDAEGNWNVQQIIATDETRPDDTDAGATDLGAVAIDSIRLTGGNITVRDHTLTPGEVFEVELREIDLTIIDLAVDRQIGIEFATALDALPGGRLTYEGKVGPLQPPAGESFRIDGQLELEDIDAPALGEMLQRAGVLDSVPADFFGDAPITVEADVEVGIVMTDNGMVTNLDAVAIDLDGTTLALEGRLADEGKLKRVDLSLLPSRVRAEHIRSLLAIAVDELPMTFESASPLEVEARLAGLLGGKQLPEVTGSATFDGYTFYHPSLEQPMEKVGAKVSIGNDRLSVERLTGLIGSSDLSGDLTLVGFDAPRVTFDIRSKHADFFELFSFMKPAEETAADGAGDAADAEAEDLLRSAVVEGTVAIERGSFQTLDFTNLSAKMRWVDGVLTMDPFEMDLYDGHFGGTLSHEPLADPPRFDLRGQADAVDLDAILTDNVGVEGMLRGRFSGEVGARGAGSDFESIVRSLDGGGAANIEDGFLGALDVLGTLSNVTGIFGEQTLSQLSRQMQTDGTEFSRASTGIRVKDGKLGLENVLIESPALDLRGQGVVDLLSQGLAGNLDIAFSREVSDLMKAEGSRAGEVFWNSSSDRVEFPFELSGTLAEPSAGVDWGAAAQTYAKREAEGYLKGLLAEKLGVATDENSADTGGVERAAEPDSVAPQRSATTETRSGPGGLEVKITEIEWSGSFLMQDLRFKGEIRGERLDYGTLVVTDANGVELKHIEKVRSVEKWLEQASDKTAMAVVKWSSKIDGKKIATATPPFTITMTAFNTDGASAEASRTVNK